MTVITGLERDSSAFNSASDRGSAFEVGVEEEEEVPVFPLNLPRA